ncbi:hypothetical protein CLAFUW4_08104 [Fulvia fulva]|uniref:Uncharacterized protein n=1 Tax=Passalora fulva TaxID=5499 RepID=A0A9Q8LD66_PASFU|nr:uncharacterized protein CLAFUR5_08221 [Fulvia fulva]KAK4629394.1 hypothetical protein CLAFUR4_08109 [Fulvia fulva]KAK4630757.1 hypothetical protein CLAFUR0_08104 [Fulvia fulva]UJO15237.1 hypothetical protein CLAFUR5_08221 [Fulvia fulva]WPV12166.1 hypothetical protein CLAFUW4_08104 [Fulvia fulva]WPV27876.1 hypothetical protein CLAFUW7_08104 [Fulvia fulva]
MEWLQPLILLGTTLIALVQAQQSIPQSNNGSVLPIWGLATLVQGGSSPLCNKTFNDANGTGVFSFNPNVPQGPQQGQPENFSGRTQPVSIAVTLQNPGFNSTNSTSTAASYTLWYDTNGANYSDRYALGYDVCALVGFSLNYNTQLRGQSDNGSCLSTLDQPCISAIVSTVQQYATWLTTASPGPDSNLTTTSLPDVCRDLSHALVENFPKECSYFFQDKLDGLAYPLTSFGDQYQTGLTSNCTMNGTFQNTLSFYSNRSQSIYTAWADSVTPVIGVWMPVADAGAQTTITETVANVFCGHIDDINGRSYQPPDLPQPTPVAYNATTNTTNTNSTMTEDTETSDSSGLSGGAIAGIVIGVLTALVIVAGLIYWLMRRRRAQKKPQDVTAEKTTAELHGQDSRFELGGDDAKKELPAEERKAHARTVSELEAKTVQREPAELPAS